MKIKIGDRVKIIDCQDLDSMYPYVGSFTTIIGNGISIDFFKVHGNDYCWHKDWLELEYKDFITEKEMEI